MKPLIVLSLAFTVPFLSASVDTAARTRTAKVQAAHIIAYAALAQRPAQLSEDSFEDVIEEDPETGGPYAGPIDSKAAEIIDAAVERALERSGFTWEEIRRLAVTAGKINAAFSSRDKIAIPETQLIVFYGPGCDACETFKKAVFPGLIESRWKIGKWGEPAVKVVTLSVEEYERSPMEWNLAEADGTYSIPRFLIVRGEQVLARGRLQKGKKGLELTTDNAGIKPMTASAVADWVNATK